MEIKEEKIKIKKITNLLKNSEDNGTFLDSLYDLYIFIGIAKGVDDANNGRCMTLEEFSKERETLYKNILIYHIQIFIYNIIIKHNSLYFC